jgi:hypothetical protein
VPPGRRPPAPGSHAHRISPRYRGGLLVTQVRLVFPGPFEPFPSSRSQPRGIPSNGVSLATLLSIAIGVVTRRRAQVCTLPLKGSGHNQSPLAAYLLRQAPTASTRVRFSFNRTMPYPLKSAFTLRFPDLNEPHYSS